MMIEELIQVAQKYLSEPQKRSILVTPGITLNRNYQVTFN